MELSWWALAPTITIALVLAAIVLLRSDERARANVGKRAAEMSLADVIPSVYTALVHTTTWLRNARRPVWLIDYKDLKPRVRRMVKVPTPTARADFQARKVTGIRVA